MRTEVDNWLVVVDGFAASSLRIIFVGQTAAGQEPMGSCAGCLMPFAIFGDRLCDIVKKRKHPCLRRWSMFSSHTG